MFKQLAEIAKSTSIHLIITTSGEAELKVMVLPQSKEGADPALCQPLILTASPEELDEKFVSVLTEYKVARKSLEETLEEAKLVMDAAGKAAQKSATAATKQAAAKPAPAPTAVQPAKTDSEASEPATEEDELTLF